MRLDVVRDDGVLAAAHVLADVGHALPDAARHVVSSIGHAAHDGGEVGLAVLGVLPGVAVEDALDVAEAEARRRHVAGGAAVRVVVVAHAVARWLERRSGPGGRPTCCRRVALQRRLRPRQHAEFVEGADDGVAVDFAHVDTGVRRHGVPDHQHPNVTT